MTRTLAALAFAVCTASAAFSQTSITSCGSIVPPRGTGVVANDITCSPSDPFVVRVDDRAKLDLAGHTLSGGVRGVHCTGKCVLSSTGGPATIRDADTGLNVTGSRARFSDLNFDNNSNNILCDVSTTKLRGERVNINGGGQLGIQAARVHIAGLTITGASPGIRAQGTTLEGGSSITGSLGGIQGGKVRLVNSTVTGNTPWDLQTLTRPRLTASTCDRSQNLANELQNWGVCSLD